MKSVKEYALSTVFVHIGHFFGAFTAAVLVRKKEIFVAPHVQVE